MFVISDNQIKPFSCEMKVKACCNCNDIEEFIKEVYGQVYEICPCEEVGSRQYAATYNLAVKKQELDTYELNKLETFKSTGEGMFILQTILTDLCNRDLLLPAEYVIDVSW